MVAIYIITLSEDENTEPEMRTAIRCLDYLFKSNQQKKRIENSLFINPTVSDHLNMNFIAKEYYDKKRGLANQNEDTFAFLDYPWLFSTEAKAEVLQMESKLLQQDQVISSIMGDIGNNLGGLLGMLNGSVTPHLRIVIRRENLLEDALNQLSIQSGALKKPLKIKFSGEDGVDEGGVRKEFFQLLIEQLFNPNYAMFITKNVKKKIINRKDIYGLIKAVLNVG